MTTERRYNLDGTIYHVLVIDTDRAGMVLCAPEWHWSHSGYGRDSRFGLAGYIAGKLAEHKVRAGDRKNLARCLEAAFLEHIGVAAAPPGGAS